MSMIACVTQIYDYTYHSQSVYVCKCICKYIFKYIYIYILHIDNMSLVDNHMA